MAYGGSAEHLTGFIPPEDAGHFRRQPGDFVPVDPAILSKFLRGNRAELPFPRRIIPADGRAIVPIEPKVATEVLTC